MVEQLATTALSENLMHIVYFLNLLTVFVLFCDVLYAVLQVVVLKVPFSKYTTHYNSFQPYILIILDEK